MQQQIIIDTDPGVDDALALMFCLKSGVNVKAVTTVYGNANLANTTKNAGYIIRNLKSGWDVHVGASQPLKAEPHFAKSHGDTGLGNLHPTDSEIAAPSSDSAAKLFSSLEIDEENILFCLGPLTNIALAFESQPDLTKQITKLIVMAGAFSEKGNVTEFAEFNAYNDPEAFEKVIQHAARFGLDTTVIPAEVCRKVILTTEDLSVLDSHSLLPDLRAVVEPFIAYYMKDKAHGGLEGAVLYDVLVPLYYLYPELFTHHTGNVTIESSTSPLRGKTSFSPKTGSTIKVCTDVDASNAKEIIMNTLTLH